LLTAFLVTFSLCDAATVLPNGSGLAIVTFPDSISGNSFTDTSGNVVTVESAFFVAGGEWFGSGDITVSFASPVTAAGFTFVNLCGNCEPPIIPDFTVIDRVTLYNGDSYNVPTGIAAGSGAPGTQFFGVSSANEFTSATFELAPFSSFALSDFRFGDGGVVPEPVGSNLIAPALLVFVGALKLRSIHRR
jgi:hypothetical protein